MTPISAEMQELMGKTEEELISMLGQARDNHPVATQVLRVLDYRRARQQAGAAAALLQATEKQASAGDALVLATSPGGHRRMTKDEAIAFHCEMEALLARGPGGGDDEARHQLQRIRFACHPAPDGHAYLREKIVDACESLDTWLSPQKWQRWGEDPKIFQRIVHADVYKVRRAIDTAFREAAGGRDGPLR